MQSALWVSKTGLAAMDAKLTTISNNLANVDTTGFKKDRVSFQDLYYQVQTQPGAKLDQQNESPSGIQLGTGVRVVGTQKVFTSGDTKTTSNQLDLAIDGNGFFKVELPNGETAYTRDGAFQVNAESVIVNASGLPLQPQITVPANTTAITISQSGLVNATVGGQTTPQQIGQITLANFVNEAGLLAMGGNLFQQTAASGQPVTGAPADPGFGTLNQGYLESSNVDPVSEISNMISAQRAYEMNSKVISTADQMLSVASQVKG